MKYQISELVDLPGLQKLMESFYRATGINHALIDRENRVLAATGWEPVCSKFHRRNPRTCQACTASEDRIFEHLHDDGPYVIHQCPNGLMDYATPVTIDGKHVASIFTGQIFHASPDLDFFRRQAKEFDFPEEPYLEAVRKVRVVPRERMPEVMAFLVGLAETLGQQGNVRLRQLEAEKELRQLNQELSARVLERTRELQEKNRLLSQEIAGHKTAEDALRQEKQFSDDAINSLPGIFYMLDVEGRFVRWNRKFTEVTGYTDGELAGMPALQLFEDQTAPLIRERIEEVFEQGESSVEASLTTKAGRQIPHYFTGRRTRIGERPYLVGLGIDISARKTLEKELERQAHEDSLTGMATRRHFFELAERELARTRRYGCPLSFLVIDIDYFKDINDSYGHGLGDEVLKRFAGTCRSILREVDVLGRIGGDEFAVLLPKADTQQALQVGERLRASIAAMEIANGNGQPIPCTISIGATTLTSVEDDIDLLFSQADQALYRAKKEGRNRCQAY